MYPDDLAQTKKKLKIHICNLLIIIPIQNHANVVSFWSQVKYHGSPTNFNHRTENDLDLYNAQHINDLSPTHNSLLATHNCSLLPLFLYGSVIPK